MATIELSGVPEDVRDTLAARAEAQGLSLSDYLVREVTRAARRPTLAELDRIAKERGRVDVGTEAILAARDEGRRG